MVAFSLPFSDGLLGRRAHRRARLDAQVCYLSRNRIILARTGDVSLEGAFVSTWNPDPVGTLATLRIEDGERSFFAEAKVVRVSFASTPDGRGPGMGLRFSPMSSEQRRALVEFTRSAC